MIQCIDLYKSYKTHGGHKHVLRDVNLSIAPGDHVGLLGRNGAGKTTLLKLLGGVEIPTQGRVQRTMSCSWPLGFAGGFQGSLTGYDNMRFISRIYGQAYSYVKTYVEEFTELGRSLAQPVKTYSSGMRARLAFALSLVIEFDCYLIDEVIMVGDQNFQEKCHAEFFEKRADRALIIASHSTEVIRQYCKSAIIVRDQIAYHHDDIEEAIATYASL